MSIGHTLPPSEVAAGPGLEVLARLAAASRVARTELPPQLADALDAVGDAEGETWLNLLGVPLDAGAPYDVERLLAAFSTIDPVELRRHLLGRYAWSWCTLAGIDDIEASAAGADLDVSRNDPFFSPDVNSSSISWLATVTGRVGYAAGSWLAYAKGGWAGADVELTLFDPNTPVRAHSSTWANGWTVGGGAEYRVSQRISLGVEYDYVELDTGSWTVSCGNCPSGLGGGAPVVDGDLAVQAVTARLNCFFGR